MKNLILSLVSLGFLFSCQKDEIETIPENKVVEHECVLPPPCGEELEVKTVYYDNYCQPYIQHDEFQTIVARNYQDFYKIFSECNYYHIDQPVPHNVNIQNTDEPHSISQSRPKLSIVPYTNPPNFSEYQLIGVYEPKLNSEMDLFIHSVVEDDCVVTVHYYKESNLDKRDEYMPYSWFWKPYHLKLIPKTDKPIVFKEFIKQDDHVIIGTYNNLVADGNDIFYKLKQNQLTFLKNDFVSNLSEMPFENLPQSTTISVDLKTVLDYIPAELVGSKLSSYKDLLHGVVGEWIYIELMIDNKKTIIHLPEDSRYYENNYDLKELKRNINRLMSIINASSN